jgi:hypothetical protein
MFVAWSALPLKCPRLPDRRHRLFGRDETPNASLKGLRIYLAEGDMSPVEVPPPPSPGLPPPLVPADPAAPET